MMFYERVFRELNRRGVRYIVIGGVAVNLHGVPRTTADLDLLVDLQSPNLQRLVEAMKNLGYRPRAPVRFADITLENLRAWVKEKHMRVLSFTNPKRPQEEVDILVNSPVNFEEVYGRIEFVAAKGLPIPLISLDDLITLKRSSRRLQDLSDVEALRKVKRIRGGLK